MKISKFKDSIKNKSIKELNEELNSLHKEQFNIRMQQNSEERYKEELLATRWKKRLLCL